MVPKAPSPPTLPRRATMHTVSLEEGVTTCNAKHCRLLPNLQPCVHGRKTCANGKAYQPPVGDAWLRRCSVRLSTGSPTYYSIGVDLLTKNQRFSVLSFKPIYRPGAVAMDSKTMSWNHNLRP